MGDIHYNLYRRAIRRCCDHEVVSELTNPDLPLLSVFTSKKYRMPWQKTKLVRAYVTLADVLDSSVGSEHSKKLSQLAEVREQSMLDNFKEHFEVNDKGNLKATAKSYAHVNLDAEEKYVVDVELGAVTYKEIKAESLDEVLPGLKVQQNHFVLKERKPRSLYVVIRCDLAEKIIMTTDLQTKEGASAGVDIKTDIGDDAGLSADRTSQTNAMRNFKSTIGFKCCQLRINGDNTLSLKQYDFGQRRLDMDETDSGATASGRGTDSTDGGVSGFRALLQPFTIVQQRKEVQAVILDWVKSCPSEDVICFIEELLDNILTTGETAKSCQLPASWVCKSFVAESLTEATVALLKSAGISVIQSPYQEAELQWMNLSDDDIDLLSACLRIVSLTDDLNSDQQAAIGYVAADDANNVIDVLLAASEFKAPKMDLKDKNRTTWATFEHPSVVKLCKMPIAGAMQSFGIHLQVSSETSAMFDSYLLDEGRLQNIAALIHMLCLSVA